MIVMHLGQGAVSTLHRRRGPLKGLGMLGRPRFPARSHLGNQLSGEGMRLKGPLHRLEHLEQLGFALATPRARYLLLPVHQRQQVPLHPGRPHRRQGDLTVHILPHRLPPHVDHGGQTGELLADFVQHLLFDR